MSRRNALATIAERLEAIEKILRNYITAISSQDKREADKSDKPTEIRGEIWFPIEVENNRGTEQGRQHTTQKWIAKGTWAATIAAIVYASIAAYQTSWVRQATIAAQKQLTDFEAVEAAQIYVEFAPKVTMGKPGQGLIVNGSIDITNIGQTTAVNFTATGSVWVVNLIPPTPGIPSLRQETSPVTPLDVSGIRLGSGRVEHFPVGFQVDNVDEIRRNNWRSGLLVTYEYSDVFGQSYSGRDCFMVNPMNVLEFIRCPRNTFR